MSYDALREEAARGNAILGQSGLVVLSFGNLSVADRAAGVMAIKPSGISYADLRPDEMPIVDLADGSVLAGATRPSSDTPTHLVLYRHFAGIGSIVHTHSLFATAWAQARRELPCLGTTHADHFRGPVPVTRPLTPREIESDYEAATGRVIVERFSAGLDPGATPGVLVSQHGPFVWGPDLDAALAAAIALEHAAAVATHQIGIGSLEPLTDELRDCHFQRKHGPTAYYGQATSHASGEPLAAGSSK